MKLENFETYLYDKRKYSTISILRKGSVVIPVTITRSSDVLDDDVCAVDAEVALEVDWLFDETYQISKESETMNKRFLLLPNPSEHPIITDCFYVGFLVNQSALGFSR